MSKIVTFIFVHGTFNTSGKWTEMQGALTAIVAGAGQVSEFKELRWSGKNRVGARRSAADQIATLVGALNASATKQQIFLIGHSHGGSAVAHFIKEHPQLSKNVAGFIFLSTPFIAIRPRVHMLEFSLMLCLFLFVFPLLLLFLLFADMLSAPWNWLSWLASCIYFYFSWPAFDFKIRPEAITEIVSRQTADIPFSKKFLFLRCSGDEAAAFLSVAQFLSWISAKVFIAIFSPRIFPKSKSVGLDMLGEIWAIMSCFVGLSYIAGFAIGYLPNEFETPIMIWLCLSMLINCLVGMTVLLLAIGQSATAWSFGLGSITATLCVELAIEPLPFGEHSLVHVDWSKSAGIDRNGVHRTYANPFAIKYIGSWVYNRLTLLGEAVSAPTLYV
jgi:pimeloyl-ACP methyl ester carboxylesterase